MVKVTATEQNIQKRIKEMKTTEETSGTTLKQTFTL